VIAVWDYDDPALPALRKTEVFRRLRQICCDETGVVPSGPRSVELDNLIYEVLRVAMYEVPAPERMVKPLKAQLADVERCLKGIAKLDSGCRAVICMVDPAVRRAEFEAERAGLDPHGVREAMERAGNLNCIDRAVAPLTELQQALKAAIEAARGFHADPWRPSGWHGRGRRANRPAYEVADRLSFIYARLSGTRPGFWKDPEKPTPFGRMVKAVFDELGIKADIRGPAQAAIRSLTPEDMGQIVSE
jgi:hypothetical protein